MWPTQMSVLTCARLIATRPNAISARSLARRRSIDARRWRRPPRAPRSRPAASAARTATGRRRRSAPRAPAARTARAARRRLGRHRCRSPPHEPYRDAARWHDGPVITEVPGVRVGHAQRTGDGWLTGVTVVVPPPGTVGAVDVRGGGPGTHETDALAPGTLVDTVDAVVLMRRVGVRAGGGARRAAVVRGAGARASRSACATTGVRSWCRSSPRRASSTSGAVATGTRGRTPRWVTPQPLRLSRCALPRGAVGAGTGARTARGSAPGGVGNGLVRLPGRRARGCAGRGERGGGGGWWRLLRPAGDAALNTTLAVVVTNARLDVAEATRAAGAGHDGLARSIDPVHTLSDGDTVFVLATGEIDSAAAAPEVEAGWPGRAAGDGRGDRAGRRRRGGAARGVDAVAGTGRLGRVALVTSTGCQWSSLPLGA